MAKAGEVFGYPPDDPLYDMEVSGVGKPIENIPVTDAIGKGETPEVSDSYLTTSSEEKTQEEKTEEPKALPMTDETLIIDDRDGKTKPWKEVKGLAVLKKDSDAEKYQTAQDRAEIDRQKAIVDQNMPFLDAVGKSRFATTLANTLAQGISEEQAIAAAFAATGKSNPFVAAEQNQDPEPKLPDDFDINNPEHAAKGADHLRWELRQEMRQNVKAMVDPIQAELNALKAEKQEGLRKQQEAQTEAQKREVHNRTVLQSIPEFLSFDLKSLNPDQGRQFWDRFNESAAALGVGSDHYLTKAEVKGILADAVPGGKNPFVSQPTNIVIDTKPKQPLQPGVSGGAPQTGAFPQSDADRMRSMLEAMSGAT